MIWIKKFSRPPKLKYGSSRCFSPGSLAVFASHSEATISSFSLAATNLSLRSKHQLNLI